MTFYNKFFITFLILIVHFNINGQQVNSTAYAEYEIDNRSGRAYRIIPMGEKGLACILESSRYIKNGKRHIVISTRNTSLDTLWKKTFSVSKYHRTIEILYRENSLYFLMAKEGKYEYKILKVAMNDGDASVITFVPIGDNFITHFEVVNDVFYFAGKIKNNPSVVIFDYKNNQTTHLRSINQLKAKIVNLQIDEKHDYLNVMMYKSTPAYERGLYFNRYDLSGKIIYNFSLNDNKDYRLLSYKSYIKNKDEFIVFGTYALNSSDKAQGVYVMKFDNGKLRFSRFYDFFYLKNFFNYLNDKQKEKLIARIKNKRQTDKKFKLNYRMFLHDPLFIEDKIVLVGETYKASSESHSLEHPSYSDYGSYLDPSLRRIMENRIGNYGEFLPSALAKDRPINITSLPSELDYIHSFSCVFDDNGKLLWDNSFKFDETLSTYPLEPVGVFIKKDTTLFMEPREEEMRFQVTKGSRKPDTLYVNEIDPSQEGDKMQYFYSGGVISWYGEHFIESGIKELSSEKGFDNSRNVFFIRKWTYDPSFVHEKPEESEDENNQ